MGFGLTFSRGAVVLCGGASRRIGRDKALLPLGDEVMLQRTVRLLREALGCDAVVVVAAARQALPPLPPGVQVIRDEAPSPGPVPAIAAGLAALAGRAQMAFVTGCDAPLLHAAAIGWLFQRLDCARSASSPGEEPDALVLRDADRLYPLAAAYRTSCADGFAQAWAIGEASLRGALASPHLHPLLVDVEELRTVDPQLDLLVNCNTPEEYEAAVKRALSF